MKFLLLLAILVLFPATIAAGSPASIRIVDDLNREVILPRPATRIVSLVPSHTEILFALGADDQVVGVDEYSNWPKAAQSKPQVGNLNGINYEMILALQADLVLVLTSHQNQGVIERLTDLGIPVLALEAQSMAETYETIATLGTVTGCDAQAEELISQMQARVAAVIEATSGLPAVPVFYEVWHDPLMTAGPGSFIQELIELAGGRNIAEDAASAWPTFSLESLIQRDPQVIITSFEQTIADLDSGARPQWQTLSAVRNGRYYLIDPDIIGRPGPRIVDGLEAIAAMIHPKALEAHE
ncbi:MAG: cobalamin-binding protein [Firmicutes bacterium]|nr:cobalamin-binding protein [Bacillota bacterium]